MKYTVEISAPARKQIKRMPKLEKRKILDKIDSLSNDPRPFGYKKLNYYNEYFRVRVGNYRIIYTIHEKQLLVVIVEVPDRRAAY